jgi:hypothetical protein
MPKPRDPRQLTKKETIERLQEAKNYLGNKERIAYMRPSEVHTPDRYDPELIDSCYSAPKLHKLALRRMTSDTLLLVDYNWPDDVRFKRVHAAQFVAWCFGHGAVIGETVSLVFYSWKKPDCSVIAQPRATKFATLWLGTWHHAPILVWTDKTRSVKVDSLPKYSDLIK